MAQWITKRCRGHSVEAASSRRKGLSRVVIRRIPTAQQDWSALLPVSREEHALHVKHRQQYLGSGAGGRRGKPSTRLTRNDAGVIVPKQFAPCRGACLLQEALQRASAVAALQRVCSVVAEQHRQWWTPSSITCGAKRHQRNRTTAAPPTASCCRCCGLWSGIRRRRGSAAGRSLPARRGNHGRISCARRPSWQTPTAAHDVSARHGARRARDTELGYILPTSCSRMGAVDVLRFIEKPNEIRARVLLDQGALWNVFIMAASVEPLLSLFDARYAATIATMRGFEGANLESVYRDLRRGLFSRGAAGQGNP